MMFFISGILAALFAAVFEIAILIAAGFGSMLLQAALVEELLKFFVLWKVSQKTASEKLLPFGALFFATGFGGTEAFMAISRFPDAPQMALFGIFSVHAATIVWYGYAIQRKFSRALLGIAVLFGFAIHLAYNLFFV